MTTYKEMLRATVTPTYRESITEVAWPPLLAGGAGGAVANVDVTGTLPNLACVMGAWSRNNGVSWQTLFALDESTRKAEAGTMGIRRYSLKLYGSAAGKAKLRVTMTGGTDPRPVVVTLLQMVP